MRHCQSYGIIAIIASETWMGGDMRPVQEPAHMRPVILNESIGQCNTPSVLVFTLSLLLGMLLMLEVGRRIGGGGERKTRRGGGPGPSRGRSACWRCSLPLPSRGRRAV